MIERLHLHNFTAFEDLELNFSSGVNVLIGGNGTGKTHVLKAIYGLIHGPSRRSWGADNIPEDFEQLFLPLNQDLSRLQRVKGKPSTAALNVEGHGVLDLRIPVPEDGRAKLRHGNAAGTITGLNTVYFPPKDIVGHATGFRSLLKIYETTFDKTYTDILDLAFLPSRKSEEEKFIPILKKLKKLMGNGTPFAEEDQYFLSIKGKRIEFSLVAEGWRKIAVFWYILRNYPHLTEGDSILWDEPEANLNPTALAGLAECLADLSKLGFQIFIATHSYVLLKELEIHQAKDLQFISLYQTKNNGVKASIDTQYNSLEPNLIEQENERLYYAEIGLPLEEASFDESD